MKTYKKHTVYKLNAEGTSTGESRYKWITSDNMPNQNIPISVGNTDYDRIILEIDSGEAEFVETDDTDYPNYAEKRRRAYGSWGEQLDMMYHGTWNDHVASVKAANPKE